MMKRCFSFLLLFVCMGVTALSETGRWTDVLYNEFPTARIIRETGIGQDEGLLAVILVDENAVTVIIDRDTAGKTRLHINEYLFASGVPETDDLWLSDKFSLMRPFLWYTPENPEERFYITLQRDGAGAWHISHAEFDADETSCAYTAEGTNAYACGETLYPQVYTLQTLDLAFASFDLAAAEAHCRTLLAAPKEYLCYGLDCMENGPCQEHGLYVP